MVARPDTFLAQQLRRARGSLSQEDLAYKVREVTRGTLTPAPTDISRYERSVHAPRMAMLVAIAKATGKDIEFFLNESEEAEDDEEAALQALASQAVEVGRYDMAEGLLALARKAGMRKLGVVRGGAAWPVAAPGIGAAAKDAR